MSKLISSRVTPSYITPPTKPDKGATRIGHTTWRPDLAELATKARAAIDRAKHSKVIHGIAQSKCKCLGKCECGGVG